MYNTYKIGSGSMRNTSIDKSSHIDIISAYIKKASDIPEAEQEIIVKNLNKFKLHELNILILCSKMNLKTVNTIFNISFADYENVNGSLDDFCIKKCRLKNLTLWFSEYYFEKSKQYISAVNQDLNSLIDIILIISDNYSDFISESFQILKETALKESINVITSVNAAISDRINNTQITEQYRQFCESNFSESDQDKNTLSVSKLLYYIVKNTPKCKLFSIADNINNNHSVWKYDDEPIDYCEEIQKDFMEAVLECAESVSKFKNDKFLVSQAGCSYELFPGAVGLCKYTLNLFNKLFEG